MFDQGTPVPLRRFLSSHRVETAYEKGWSSLNNGELLSQAESEGFDVLVTTDKNLRYQEDLTTRVIAIVVLGTTSWPRMQKCLPAITAAVNAAKPGSYVEVEVPSERTGG